MSLTIAVLSWGSQETLANSLESYREKGLLDLADQLLLFFQEVTEMDEKLAQYYDFDYIGSPTNLGIAAGYKRLLEETTSDLFLFLENDWELIRTYAETKIHMEEAVAAIENQVVDLVRLRHREVPGWPLWTLQFKGQEYRKPTHLLDSVHWTDPEKFAGITKSGNLFVTTSKFANWTNNPTLAKAEFLREHIYPRLGGDIEQNLQPWWEQQEFKVAQGEGLFTHNRKD